MKEKTKRIFDQIAIWAEVAGGLIIIGLWWVWLLVCHMFTIAKNCVTDKDHRGRPTFKKDR